MERSMRWSFAWSRMSCADSKGECCFKAVSAMWHLASGGGRAPGAREGPATFPSEPHGKGRCRSVGGLGVEP